MAHIAEFMVESQGSVGMNDFIARGPSPISKPPSEVTLETPLAENNDKYVWRMNQPSESHKYQLFPPPDSTSTTANKMANTEAAPWKATHILDRNRSGSTGALRSLSKEPNLTRRRKASVSDLGPMTTVQEVAMDSPTIPGRPPLHERSISAPGNNWRQHMFGESMLSCISGPAPDENAEMAVLISKPDQLDLPSISQISRSSSRSTSPKHHISPKKLTPLVIPSSSQPHRIVRKAVSSGRIRSESTPPEVPPKPGKMDVSPHPRANLSPYTPLSNTPTGLLSATTAPTTASNTPKSANLYTSLEDQGRSSPKPHTGNQPEVESATGSSRSFPLAPTKCHRRTGSETSVMDRGRPKKRLTDMNSSIKRSASKRTPATPEEKEAFEYLPTGHIPSSASSLLPSSEVLSLRTQAMGQASRFQVLTQTDVSALSRELRALDERCEYLRKTHRSLRSGRRNLHERMCSYLRSPRIATFSHDSMLKQEEALSELDNSIDDWVFKLEQAENRRTRVRQKLLEHVAAALILTPQIEEKKIEMKQHITRMDRVQYLHTPPRSPTKMHSPSPERLERVVEEVKVANPDARSRRGDVHSIKIYADSDISALLRDVEEEINRMGEQSQIPFTVEKQTKDTTGEEIMLHAVAFEGMNQNKRNRQAVQAQQ